jgi:hypothetical protein
VQDLAPDHHEAARQRLGEPLQVQPGEQQMRRGRTHVDADGGELDVVERPRDVEPVLVGPAAITVVAVMVDEARVVLSVVVTLVEKRAFEEH